MKHKTTEKKNPILLRKIKVVIRDILIIGSL